MKAYNIIGAGIIGCFIAKKLASKGNSVAIYEKKSDFKRDDIAFSKYDELFEGCILNNITKIRVIRNKRVNYKNGRYCVVDLSKLNKKLAYDAIEKGVVIYLNHELKELNSNFLYFRNKKGMSKVERNSLIGCDGDTSFIGSKISKRKYEYFIEGEIKGNFDKEVAQIKIKKEYRSIIIPHSKSQATLKVISKKLPKQYFDKVSSKYNVKSKKGGVNLKSVCSSNKTVLLGSCAIPTNSLLNNIEKQIKFVELYIKDKKKYKKVIKKIQRREKLNEIFTIIKN